MISVKGFFTSQLNQYRKTNNVNWEDFYDWIQVLTEEKVPKLVTLKVTLSRLDKKCAKLKRSKQNDKLKLLMDETGLVNSTEKRDSSRTIMNLAVADLSSKCEQKIEQKG